MLNFFIDNNISNESAFLEFNKYDYQIIYDNGDFISYDSNAKLNYFLQFSQNNDSPKEYYFYFEKYHLNIFLPVFGN